MHAIDTTGWKGSGKRWHCPELNLRPFWENRQNCLRRLSELLKEGVVYREKLEEVRVIVCVYVCVWVGVCVCVCDCVCVLV